LFKRSKILTAWISLLLDRYFYEKEVVYHYFAHSIQIFWIGPLHQGTFKFQHPSMTWVVSNVLSMWSLLGFGVSLNSNALATRMVLFKDPMFTSIVVLIYKILRFLLSMYNFGIVDTWYSVTDCIISSICHSVLINKSFWVSHLLIIGIYCHHRNTQWHNPILDREDIKWSTSLGRNLNVLRYIKRK
jgi:hypothetical protein